MSSSKFLVKAGVKEYPGSTTSRTCSLLGLLTSRDGCGLLGRAVFYRFEESMPFEVVSGIERAQTQKEHQRTLAAACSEGREFALSGSGPTDPSSYDCALGGCMEVKLRVDRRGNFDRISRLNLTTQSCAVRRVEDPTSWRDHKE
jgi:hypothetical protein